MIAATSLALAVGLVTTPIEISGVGHQRSVPCEGRDVVVDGVDHVLTFTGNCASLTLAGSGNKVVIDLKPGASIDVSGTNQSVRWRSAKPPKVSVAGVDNTVSKAP